MYWKVRRFPEAESELRETLKLDPHFEQAQYYLADAYLMDQQPDKALPLLKRLVKQQPQNVRVLVDLGKTLERLNQNDDALGAYQSALRLDPRRADTHYQLAQVYKKLNRRADFQRELGLAQKLQQERREHEETLLQASGAQGDPTQPHGGRKAAEGASPSTPP